jgi:hypothetical protein
MHICDVIMSSLVTVLLQCGLYLLTFCIAGCVCVCVCVKQLFQTDF